MKNRLVRVLILLGALGILAFPGLSSDGARTALLQWYRSVLPVLLPFLLLARLISALFPLSQNSRKFSVGLMGFLCGYPMGAILAGNEVKDARLTPEEGQWLAEVCNLPSPAFLHGLVAVEWLGLNRPWRLLASVWAAALLTGLILLLPRGKGKNIPSPNPPSRTRAASREAASFSLTLLEESWMDSCRGAVVIGCYMILFGILSSWLSAIQILPEYIKIILLLLSEITTGCSAAAGSGLSPFLKEILCATGAAFGGLSCLAQTSGCLAGTGLKISRYAGAKVLAAVLAVLANAALQTLFP